MKRFITLLLCAFIVLGLCACGKEAPEDKLLVGFGRTDITPQESVQLMGYFEDATRWSTEVLDPLYATCIAFTDNEDNTVLLFHMDLCNASGTAIPLARRAVSDSTGIPVDNILISCTHTHSGPLITSEHPSMIHYCEYLEEQIVAAAEAALKDRKPAEMYTTSATLEKMNFVRHYRMDDGSIVGDNFGTTEGKSFAGHVKDADNEMQLIRFKREGGKDVMLVNWQVHPHRTGGTYITNVSADIVGAMRMYIEPRMDCYMAYFTGASGDLNPTSSIASENITVNYLDQGTMMAQEAIIACDTMTQQKTGNVQLLRRDVEVNANDNSIKFVTYAFSIGNAAFVTAPYEMFNTNGKFIKDNSPFDTTFVVTCANSSNRYVAAEWAYEYEGVQAYEVGNGGYNKGTAEALASGFVEMLNELYPAK